MKTANEILRNAMKPVIYRNQQCFDHDVEMLLIRYEIDFEHDNRKTLILKDAAGAEYHARMEDVYEKVDQVRQP